ncbi:hypothetical protein FJTKL_00819 [Diaporthe vaccinii]|uniref:Aspartate aminotransferase n=1 Tax=Diaporthe vaccinii TaxID=105482 RepID=A0ABR4E276_9PEZI
MSRFANLDEQAPDAAFALIEQFKADPSPVKVDLSPGFYRDEDAKPWVLPSVQMAKDALLKSSSNDHEHLPLIGHAGLPANARELVFDATREEAKTIASIQTIAGTGANHLGALLLAKACRPQTVWISDPTWINHQEIWNLVDSSIQRRAYPYFNAESFTINFEAIIQTLQSQAVEGDVVILHGCAHNPPGLDFTKDQWKVMADVCQEKTLIPFFDLAYQGFATGDLADDSWSIRHLLHNTSLGLLVAESFSKNFGLYGERVGLLHVVCRTEAAQAKTVGMLTRLSRAEITTPPINGARIAARVLEDEKLKDQWLADLLHMSDRMRSMRRRLVQGLQKRHTPGSWDHILTDIGECTAAIFALITSSMTNSLVTTSAEHNPQLRLLNTLRAGSKPIMTFLGLPSFRAAQIVAQTGLDGIIIDCEHGHISDDAMHSSTAAIAALGVSPLVRLCMTHPDLIKRALDAGAHGIVVPLVNTAEEAKGVVAHSKFPLQGLRGQGSPFPGIAHGVDIHTGDEPEFLGGIEKIVAAARRHGKWVARLSNDGASCKEHLDVFDTVAMSYDVRAIQNWYRAELQCARS